MNDDQGVDDDTASTWTASDEPAAASACNHRVRQAADCGQVSHYSRITGHKAPRPWAGGAVIITLWPKCRCLAALCTCPAGLFMVKPAAVPKHQLGSPALGAPRSALRSAMCTHGTFGSQQLSSDQKAGSHKGLAPSCWLRRGQADRVEHTKVHSARSAVKKAGPSLCYRVCAYSYSQYLLVKHARRSPLCPLRRSLAATREVVPANGN